MTFLFIGAGGIGASVAARLARHASVTVADGWAAHVEAMRRQGLTLDLPDGSLRSRVHARHFADLIASGPLSGVDAVFVSVKSYDTSPVLRWLLPLLPPDVPIVSLQNGLNAQLIAGAAGPGRTIGAVVMFDGELVEPGLARTRQPEAELTLGRWPTGSGEDVVRVAEALGRALPVVVSPDIRSDLWGKLIVNCMLNAPSAASGLALRELVLSPEGPRVCAEVAREASAVAATLGVHVSSSWLYGLSPEQLGGADGGSALAERLRSSFAESDLRPSMLNDVERQRRTEIDSLNGLVVTQGQAQGISTPFNEHFVDVVHRIERGDERPSEAWLTR